MTDIELHKLSTTLARTVLGRFITNDQGLDRYVEESEQDVFDILRRLMPRGEKQILSVFIENEEKGTMGMDYRKGNEGPLASAIVAGVLQDREFRETMFNGIGNAIAVSDQPQDWLDALNEGVHSIIGHAKVEHEGRVLS